MDKIVIDLSSPQWWFTAVVVALAIGIISNYAVRLIDHFRNELPKAVRRWLEKGHENFLATIALLQTHPDAKVLYAMRSVWLRLLALLKLGAMSLCFYWAYGGASAPTNWKQWMVFCLGAAFALSAGNDNSKAKTINLAIRLATPVLDELKALE